MASSEPKKPPSHQKRTTEEPASPTRDLAVCTAFKKLKVDAEGSCVKKTESQCKSNLKHKSDCTATGDQGQRDQSGETRDCDSWSESFKSICLCDEEAFRKRGRRKWNSMCRFHQLGMRKDRTSRNKFNLAHAVRDHKPLLQESHLKVRDSENPPQLMRSARFSFNFKGAKLSEKWDKPTWVSNKLSPSNVSKASESAACDKSAAAKPQTVFAEAASADLQDFSSLLPGDGEAANKDSGEHVPSFDNFRDSGRGSRASCTVGKDPPVASAETEGVRRDAPPAVPHVVDRALERSCSQEARVDETELGVNDMIGYFKYYFMIPKEMSSMAQMMYT
ncbi:uncharacterized protein LOC143294938 [Babylonia areolata]|uniref:uncharacterized protein LOC143294938 n=1 Tax=Babylonia areolata TaxID=304850 RepID=UPI003FD4B282